MAFFAHIVSTEHSGSSAFGCAEDYLKELLSQVEESNEEQLVMILADDFSMTSLVPFYHACTNKKKFNDKIKPVFGLKLRIQADNAVEFLLEEGAFYVDTKGNLIINQDETYKIILDGCSVTIDEENNTSIILQGKKIIVDETNRLTESGKELVQKFDSYEIKKPVFDKDHSAIVIAKNEEGRKNLNRLVSAGYQITLESKYKKINFQELKDHSEGLMFISGGKYGAIENALFLNKPELAKKRLDLFAETFDKNDIYLQVQRVENTIDGQEREEKVIEGLKRLSQEENVQLFATNDVRFPKKENYKDFIIRKKAMDKKEMYDPSDIIDISEEQYLKPTAEMVQLFSDMPDALVNTIKMTKKTDLKNYRNQLYQSYLPKFPIPEEFDNLDGISNDILEMEEGPKKEKEIIDFKSSKFLRHLSYEGLEERWSLILKNQGFDVMGKELKDGKIVNEEFLTNLKKTYQDQIDMELEVIHRTGFPGYFLIVQDVINWCKENDIPVGPGRGSGAGSIVLYCLKITDIDSIEYELLFERFLNPERVGEPDIDIDFSPRQRQRVIKYVADTYGIENTGQILTYGTMAAKDVVDNIGRVLGMLPDERNRIKDLISGEPGTKLKNELDPETGNEKLIKLRESSPQVDMLLTSALELEGSTKSYGKHAGGVVISFGDMAQYAGLYQEAKDQGVTENAELQARLEERGLETLVPTVQVDKNLCETVGLIKFDFLGLKNLDIIDDCIKFLNRNEPSLANFKASDISPHDEKAIDLFRVADTYGIFQFESPAMRRLMKQMVPDSYDEVIALVALFRPGPLQSGMAEDFVNRKHGKSKVEYPHKDLSTLLKATYGTIIYQEQVMSISRILAGFTRGEADTLRKAMGKKIFELMKQMRKLFAEGAGHKYRQDTIDNTSAKYPSVVNKGQCLSIDINLEDVEHPKLKSIVAEDVDQEHIDKMISKFNFFGRFISTKEQVIAFLKEYAELTEEEIEELDIQIDGMKDKEFFQLYRARIIERGMPKLEADGLSKADAELLLSRFFVGSSVFVRFNEIFSKMNEFAAYGFNASHSVAYANVSMQTAYLKSHYPTQYMAALISNDANLDKASETARECRRMGINILRPDINKSKLNFYALTAKPEERRMRYGLGMIRAVANKAKHIIARREKHGKINDIYEFHQLFADYKTQEIVQKDGIVKEQNSRVIDITVLKALLNSGALDSLCPENDSNNRAMLLATYNHIDNTFTDLRKRLKKNYNEIKKKVNAKSVKMTHTDIIESLDEGAIQRMNLTLDMDKKSFLEALELVLMPQDLTQYDLELFFKVYNTVDKLVSEGNNYHSTEEFLNALTKLSGIPTDSKLANLSLNMIIEYYKSTFTKLEKSIKELDKTINKKTAKKPEVTAAKEKKSNILDSDVYKLVKFLNEIIDGDVNASTIEHDGDTTILNALYTITDALKHKQMKYNSIFDLETELRTSHSGEEIEMVEHVLNEKSHYYVIPTTKETDLVPMLNTKERSEKEFNVTGMYQTTHPLMVNAMMEGLKAEEFNNVELKDMLPAIEAHGKGNDRNPKKYWNNQKIAGSILSVFDKRVFNERLERMETKIRMIVDDGTGIIQASFAAEDIFSAGREDKGLKMLLNMKDKNSDVILMEGNITAGAYESEGSIMYVKKLGSANPDIYLPVDNPDFNAVEEVSVVPASSSQINFLKTLLKRNKVDVEKVKLDYEVDDLSKLSKFHASELIGMYTGN